MTQEELHQEWSYRYHERLAMLCGTAEPTPEQDSIARAEANAAVEKLSKPDDVLIL
jgi:hypothetical protein